MVIPAKLAFSQMLSVTTGNGASGGAALSLPGRPARGNRVFENVKKHEFAIRSGILDVMRQTTEAEASRPDFRSELSAKIKVVMNDILKKYEDFGGIEDVFFTSFVMQ